MAGMLAGTEFFNWIIGPDSHLLWGIAARAAYASSISGPSIHWMPMASLFDCNNKK